jgi:hypothetical protein
MNKGLLKTIQINIDKANAKWNLINLKNEKECCRCKETKSLSNFREIEKNKYVYKKYNSFCNLCDAQRTAIYKNNKIQTIEGKVDFLFSNIKRRVREKNHELDFDKKYLIDLYFKQEGKCYYTGESMNLGNHDKIKNLYNLNFHNISVDRIDSTKGYTKGNTVLCCWGINNMKQQLTVEQLLFWAKKLIEMK